MFSTALRFVLKNEGGFVNHPDDPGGPTNFGITLATFSRWIGRPASVDGLKNIEARVVSDIYRQQYWHPAGCPSLASSSIATALFDASVLFGISAAVAAAQRAAKTNGFPDLLVDSYIGPKSTAALNAVVPKDFMLIFIAVLKARCDAIIVSRPKSAVFKKGWDTRLDRYQTLVS